MKKADRSKAEGRWITTKGGGHFFITNKKAKGMPIKPDKMGIDDLEAFIDKKYEDKAPLEEIEKLEAEFDRRVTSEDTKKTQGTDIAESTMGTEDPFLVSEGVSIDEQLVNAYANWLEPIDKKTGGRPNGMDDKDLIENMRGIFQDHPEMKPKHLSKKNILEAAKDVYDNKKKIIEKHKRAKSIFDNNWKTGDKDYDRLLNDKEYIKLYKEDNVSAHKKVLSTKDYEDLIFERIQKKGSDRPREHLRGRLNDEKFKQLEEAIGNSQKLEVPTIEYHKRVGGDIVAMQEGHHRAVIAEKHNSVVPTVIIFKYVTPEEVAKEFPVFNKIWNKEKK